MPYVIIILIIIIIIMIIIIIFSVDKTYLLAKMHLLHETKLYIGEWKWQNVWETSIMYALWRSWGSYHCNRLPQINDICLMTLIKVTAWKSSARFLCFFHKSQFVSFNHALNPCRLDFGIDIELHIISFSSPFLSFFKALACLLSWFQ